jgi:hypothetical protein
VFEVANQQDTGLSAQPLVSFENVSYDLGPGFIVTCQDQAVERRVSGIGHHQRLGHTGKDFFQALLKQLA